VELPALEEARTEILTMGKLLPFIMDETSMGINEKLRGGISSSGILWAWS
jgi:hypothetical protein